MQPPAIILPIINLIPYPELTHELIEFPAPRI